MHKTHPHILEELRKDVHPRLQPFSWMNSMQLTTSRSFYQEGNIFCICCSYGRFLLDFLKVIRKKTCAEPDGTGAETTFLLSPKRTSPFKSAGESVQSTAGSRGVRISVSNAGYTIFRGRVRVMATHSIRQFPLHFPSRASPCATTFRTQYTLSLLLSCVINYLLRKYQIRHSGT